MRSLVIKSQLEVVSQSAGMGNSLFHMKYSFPFMTHWGLNHRDISDFIAVSFIEQQILRKCLSITKTDTSLFSTLCNSKGLAKSRLSVTRCVWHLVFLRNRLLIHFGGDFQQEGATLTSLFFSSLSLDRASIFFFFSVMALFSHNISFFLILNFVTAFNRIVAFFQSPCFF